MEKLDRNTVNKWLLVAKNNSAKGLVVLLMDREYKPAYYFQDGVMFDALIEYSKKEDTEIIEIHAFD